MNSNKDVLPEGWVLCNSKSNPGKKYFFNRKTGKSSWTQPQDDTTGKTKQEVAKTPSKSAKNETRKSSLKRKSDCTDEGTFKKRNKNDAKTPEKPTSSPRKKVTPSSKNVTPVRGGSRNSTPKNLANSRLSQLREKLNSEAKEERAKAQNSQKRKHSSAEPSSKSKQDLKSTTDSKSSAATVQSPTTESQQSSPSPSQFLAANKIISSMKAQLQEEFTEKLKPKDNFADIEQGICNQSAEYSYAKHPSTPPQFTEANKIVSAIKSKLTYKASSKDNSTISTFSTAKDRMESLRRSLNTESGEKKDLRDNVFLNKSMDFQSSCTYVAMEVEDCNTITPATPTSSIPLLAKHDSGQNVSSENVVLVVDTNIFIHELNVIKSVLNSHIKGYSEQPTLLIPWRVINELDRLKDNNNGNGAICKRAKSAMDYLYKSLPENNRIKGQSLRDSNSHIYPCEMPDDEILNCCLQQAERGKSVILLSNDKNLCNKATINQVKCLSLNELKPLLESRRQPTSVSGRDLFASVKHYRDTMYQLLANILENEMQAKYKNLWQHVLFKPPPWTLTDVLQCLLKHWIAVFNEVFPRIEHLLTDLRNTLVSIEDKDANTLTQSEVSNFKELCLDVARKCQIIPEYLELAKTTVERLSRENLVGVSERDGEMSVIDAFERIWTVFSSYCAKLSTGLGIAHSVEDSLPGDDPLEVLQSKFTVFSHHIHTLTLAMKGALSSDNGHSTEEQISKLETVFRESLNLLCLDSTGICNNNVRLFCTKCRNMLQEACTKFTQLSELLDVCKSYV